MVSFNTDPLVAPLGRQELRVLKRRRTSGEFGKHSFPFAYVLIVPFVLLVLVHFWPIAIQVVRNMPAFTPAPFRVLSWFFLAVPVFFLVLIIVMLVYKFRSPGKKKWPWLVRFADANGLKFSLISRDPRYPGLIFDRGHDRKALTHLYSSAGVLTDVGSYQYTTGSGKKSHTYTWHFAAFRLPQRVPHLLLDAKANNRKIWGTNLPDSFDSSQRLTLGAPFDDYYELYAPSGYGQDAFYLLPPNVLEALLSAPAVYDIELVDDWLFCYTQSSQDLSDPATWRLFETITNGVLDSLSPVVDRYRDRRVAPERKAAKGWRRKGETQVASQGARLRTTSNTAVVYLALGIVLIVFCIIVIGALSTSL